MWKWYGTLCFSLALLSPAIAGAFSDETVASDGGKTADIVAKHIQARGGLDAWRAVKTMKITGTFTGFSVPAPFTLYRSRPNKIWWDHMLGDKKVLIGGEEGSYWWINGWYNADKALAQSPVDANVTLQEAEFATPFFDYEQRGHRVDFAGEGSLEGQRGLVLKLVRQNGKEETWYLDPDTYLEFGRVSKGSDFGSEMDQTTFFSDFREEDGLMMPHLIETEFLIRHRVMEIDNVAINVPVAEELFQLPFPKNMEPLKALLGDWRVAVQFREQPNRPVVESETTATIKPFANGNLFLMETNVPGFFGDADTFRTLSYDPAEEHYLLTYFHDMSAHTRVMSGKIAEGLLSMDNLASDTPWKAFGMVFYEKVEISEIGAGGFTVQEYISTDKGEKWDNYLTLTFSRSPD